MPLTKTAKARKSSARRGGRSGGSALATLLPGARQAQALFLLVWATLPLVLSLALLIASIISPAVRHRVLDSLDYGLDSLGYGLIPVALLVVGFALAIRYNFTAWVRSYWRAWLASALLVSIALGIMSMIPASDGVLGDVSLGGHWGQYLGGSPLALGALKVAVLMFLTPLIIFPRRVGPVYLLSGEKFLRTSAPVLKRLTLRLASSIKSIVTKRDSEQQKGNRIVRVMGKVSAPFRMVRRALFGGSNPEPEPAHAVDTASQESPTPRQKVPASGWQLPSTELLNKGESRPVSQAVLQQMAQHIESTLADHRVDVVVEDVRTGPRIIRFGLVPGWMRQYRDSKPPKSKPGGDAPQVEMSRVKVQSILVREKDLALALKTPYLRLEAPVPGEALVGLEVPNPFPRQVVLRSVVESSAFQKIAAKNKLPVALGEDTGGEPIVADLSGLPHLLIAGATGSGKSVCINTIVSSLLLTNPPDRLRMVMVDPKRVELTPFNGIPHLVAPVIVETDEVLVVLRAMQNEMLRRYKLMEEIGVRNLEGYNKKSKVDMPFLVIIIDELADLMMAASYEVEQGLVRLAQLGRATGIHLILATQRPSVNVVTGLLKANVPSRIAFAVASQVDSRVILDAVGAEKLLGKGDMLLQNSDSPKPQRVQGTFLDDSEIEKLVEFWKLQSGPPLPEIPLDDSVPSNVGSDGGDDDDEDDVLDKARELAGRYQNLSTSVLQRRLQVGHAKATKLIKQLEDEGLVPAAHARA